MFVPLHLSTYSEIIEVNLFAFAYRLFHLNAYYKDNFAFNRSVNDEKMATFFKQNFAEDRWRKAALKNAFALLGKQRFLHAAAFFLLGGALRDAIEVSGEANQAVHDAEMSRTFIETHGVAGFLKID